jgi:NitT/TauT family transport system substrate-binding protein
LHRKLSRALSGSLLGCAVLTACLTAPAAPRHRPAQPAATEPATAESIPLKVGILPFLSSAILTIAQEEGYFAEQGLAVEFVPLKSDNDAIPLLLTGQIDVAPPAFTAGLFNAIAGGGNMKVVFPLSNYAVQDCAAFGVVARRSDIDDGRFKTPADWKGARVTIPPAGPQAMGGFIMEQALRQGGLSFKDVTLVPADLPVQADALASGQTDLVYTVEPWITRALSNPELALLMPMEPVVPGLTVSLIVFGARPLADPGIGERFAVAYLRAVRQYAEGKTPRNIELVAAHTKLEPELVKRICWTVIPPDGRLHLEWVARYQAWLQGQGLLDRAVASDEFVEPRYAEAANRALGR